MASTKTEIKKQAPPALEEGTPLPAGLVRLVDINPATTGGRIDHTKYKPDPKEKDSVHAEVEQVRFDKVTGIKTSRPFIIKCDDRAWRLFTKHAVKQGYTYIRTLHTPGKIQPLHIEPIVKIPEGIDS